MVAVGMAVTSLDTTYGGFTEQAAFSYAPTEGYDAEPS